LLRLETCPFGLPLGCRACSRAISRLSTFFILFDREISFMNRPQAQYRRLKQVDRTEAKELGSTSSARKWHGLLRCGAFVAARSRSPSIQKCSELKPPEHLGTANIQPFRQFPPRPPFLSFPLRFLRQCALSATLAMLIRRLLQRTASPLFVRFSGGYCCKSPFCTVDQRFSGL
jgi:hypothetical protein